MSEKILHESANIEDDAIFIEGVVLSAKCKLLLDEAKSDLSEILDDLEKEKSAPK